MKILVTGAKGFVGKNLCAFLNNIKYSYDRVHKINACIYGEDGLIDSSSLEVIQYDIDSTYEELESACKDCDFVFNL